MRGEFISVDCPFQKMEWLKLTNQLNALEKIFRCTEGR